MAKKINFKFVIEEDGKEQCSTILSFQAVDQVVAELIEDGDNNTLYKLLAQHPSARVRQGLTSKKDLSKEVFDILSVDTDRSVLYGLLVSDCMQKYATQELLVKYIKIDVEFAEKIAGSIMEFEQADKEELTKILIAHQDPTVAFSLAENYGLQKKVHKLLLKHPDPRVAKEAKERFSD